MNYKELTGKVLKILSAKAKEASTLDPDSIDYRVAVEELADCTLLLAGDFEPETVEKVKSSTTCGELYDLLTGEDMGVETTAEGRYMLISCCERKINAPRFFDTHEEAQYKMCEQLAEALGMTAEEVKAAYESGGDFDHPDVGLTEDTAWATSLNHENWDWQIFDLKSLK